MQKIVVLLVILWMIQSCQSDVIYNNYQTIDDAQWSHNQPASFNISMQDSITTHNIFINIRNNKNYEFSNLYLITQMTFPNQGTVIDTLEYEMTDANGRFLGTGFSDVKENKLFYKENIRFHQKGDYFFQVKQAMRKRNEVVAIDPLPGITDVGVSIEKIQTP